MSAGRPGAPASTPISTSTSTRALAAGDLDRVIAIDGATAGRTRRGFYEKRFAAMAADPRSVAALAAERGGEVAGFAFARLLDGEFGGDHPVGALDALAVDPKAREAGVGRSLLQGLEAELGRRGVRELRTQADWTERDLVSFFAVSGFELSPRLVLEREVDLPSDDGFGWDELPVRSMSEKDLPAIIRLDRKITGRDRTPYYQRKGTEALRDSGVRMSLVAEVEGQFAGFLMARVDFGDFGRTEPTAVLDTIGVDPGFGRRKVGRALLEQLLLNLRSLRVEKVQTEVGWGELGLLGFLSRTGFGLSQRLSFRKPIG